MGAVIEVFDRAAFNVILALACVGCAAPAATAKREVPVGAPVEVLVPSAAAADIGACEGSASACLIARSTAARARTLPNWPPGAIGPGRALAPSEFSGKG